MPTYFQPSRFLAAGVVFASVTGCAATGIGILAGQLDVRVAWASIALGAAIGFVAAWKKVRAVDSVTPPSLNLWDGIVLGCFALFALRAFGWLVIVQEDSIKVLSPNNLGDLSLHLAYIRHLASGAAFWPDNPILTGTPLHYPIGVDLLNALMVLCGMEVFRSLVWVGLLGSLATAFALRRWGGAFAVAGFLFSGGLAGFAFFKAGEFSDFQAAVDWKSLPLALFVTQRGLLYAFPAGLLLLDSWRSRHAGRNECALPTWVEWLLYAAMPLFHLHTFIFLSLLLAVLALCGSNAFRLHAVRLVALAMLPATLLCWRVAGFSTGSGRIHLHPGWMITEEDNSIFYWVRNFGFWLLAIPLLLWRLFKIPASQTDRVLALTATGLFLLFTVVMLAPWDWDNIKLLVWSYLVLLPLVWKYLLAPLSPMLRAPLLVLLFLSGFVSLWGGLGGTGHEIARRTTLDATIGILGTSDPNARFVAHPTWNQPVLLAGRKVAAGYDGHLLSHGYDYQATLDQVHALLRGDANWQQCAEALDVDYLFWGPMESETYCDSLRPWETRFPLVVEREGIRIYALRERTTTPAIEPASPPP